MPWSTAGKIVRYDWSNTSIYFVARLGINQQLANKSSGRDLLAALIGIALVPPARRGANGPA
jgi:hypothetical protein